MLCTLYVLSITQLFKTKLTEIDSKEPGTIQERDRFIQATMKPLYW